MLEWDGLRNASSFPGLKTDSGHFSFWLATHMPLSLGGKIAMLEMECVTERLRYILAFIQLKSDRVICCRSCGNKLASIADLFTLVGITEGTSGAYVNIHGFVHQTMTLRKAAVENILCHGEPQTKDSWFPGYAWTIANCRRCYHHLGWLFTLQANEEGRINVEEHPKSFWGFSAMSIKAEGDVHDEINSNYSWNSSEIGNDEGNTGPT